MQTVHMPDGRLVRLVPQDGPPTEPGLYLAEYTPLHGMRHTVARDVFRYCAGIMILGPDETRLEWWARIVFEAPAGSTAGVTLGGSLIRGGAVDGEANDQRGEGAGMTEPSTPGREDADRGDPWTLTTVSRADLALLLDERDALRARVAEVEAAQRWIPVTERLPETGVYILARDAVARLDIVCLDSAGHWWHSIRPLRDVTHWRTLPAGPEVQP